jgi:hypothetical protein
MLLRSMGSRDAAARIRLNVNCDAGNNPRCLHLEGPGIGGWGASAVRRGADAPGSLADILERVNVLCLRALRALGQIELDFLVLFQ